MPSRRRSEPNLVYRPTVLKNDTSGEVLRQALAEDKKELKEQSRNASRIREMQEVGLPKSKDHRFSGAQHPGTGPSGNQRPSNRTTGSRVTNLAPRTRVFKDNLSDSSSLESSPKSSSSKNSPAKSGSSESGFDSDSSKTSSADPGYVESSPGPSFSYSSVSGAQPPARRAPARLAARQASPARTSAKPSSTRRPSLVSLPSSSSVVPSSPCRKRQKRKHASSSSSSSSSRGRSRARSKNRARELRAKQEPADDEVLERARHRQGQDGDQEQPDGTQNQQGLGHVQTQNVMEESGHSCADIKTILSGMIKEAKEKIREEIREEIRGEIQRGELSNGTASFCVETVLQVGDDLKRSQRKMKRKLDKIANEKKKPRKHRRVLSESLEEEADVRSVALLEEKDGNSNSSGSGAETKNKPARVEGPAPRPVETPQIPRPRPLLRFQSSIRKKRKTDIPTKEYSATPPPWVDKVSPVINPHTPKVQEHLKRAVILQNLEELGPEQAQAALRDEVEVRFREFEEERIRQEVEQGIREGGDVEEEQEQVEEAQHTPTQEQQEKAKKAERKAQRKAEKEPQCKAEEESQRKAERKAQRKAEKEARKEEKRQQRKLRSTGCGSMWDPVVLDD
ncbi:hypothetical protein N0V88_006005 [Collariella sp. IMI 366227]|nr:hypothetical protein N0V88_006005 [Collariella sp. IMI 366227]